MTEVDALDPRYWVRQLRHTVCFADGIHEILKQPERVLLEVGPGESLCRLVKRQQADSLRLSSIASMGHSGGQENDLAGLMMATGKLWAAGVHMNWPRIYENERRNRIELPTYPFERQRYWIEQSKDEPLQPGVDTATARPASTLYPRPHLETPYVSPRNELEKEIAEAWQTTLGIEHVGIDDSFFDLGGDSLLALQVVSHLKDRFDIDVPVVGLYERLTIRALAALQSLDGQDNYAGNGSAKRENRALRRKDYQQKRRSERASQRSSGG
jgi:acyl carrier protein